MSDAINPEQLFREIDSLNKAIEATHASVKIQNGRIGKLEQKMSVVWWVLGAFTAGGGWAFAYTAMSAALR